MADRVPAGAFSDCLNNEQAIAIGVLGAKKSSFASRANSLSEMRKAVNEHERRLAELEEVLRSRPF